MPLFFLFSPLRKYSVKRYLLFDPELYVFEPVFIPTCLQEDLQRRRRGMQLGEKRKRGNTSCIFKKKIRLGR